MKDKKKENGIGFSFFALVGVLVLAKVIHSLYKKNSENNHPITISNHLEEDESNIILVSKKTPLDVPKAFEKNKWLNPTDDFGRMEKGSI